MFDQLTDGLPDWPPSTLILKQDPIVRGLSMDSDIRLQKMQSNYLKKYL